MISAVADTHAIIWYICADSRLSTTADTFMQSTELHGDQIGLSSITFVEIVYLIEKGRIPSDVLSRLGRFLEDSESIFVEIPVDLKIAGALSQIEASKVPDMPDRIIAATALNHNIPVISRDGKIRLSGILTIW